MKILQVGCVFLLDSYSLHAGSWCKMKYSSRLKKERILQGSLSGGSSLQTYSPHNHFSNWFGLKQKQQQQQQHNIYVCLMVFVVYFALFSFDDETKHEGAKTICR